VIRLPAPRPAPASGRGHIGVQRRSSAAAGAIRNRVSSVKYGATQYFYRSSSIRRCQCRAAPPRCR
jgi:hypothetical protein